MIKENNKKIMVNKKEYHTYGHYHAIYDISNYVIIIAKSTHIVQTIKMQN